jgi:hypothetical protein
MLKIAQGGGIENLTGGRGGGRGLSWERNDGEKH